MLIVNVYQKIILLLVCCTIFLSSCWSNDDPLGAENSQQPTDIQERLVAQEPRTIVRGLQELPDVERQRTVVPVKDPYPNKNHVIFRTNMGDFMVKLASHKALNTVANFKHYVATGFYDGLSFHRVIKNFMLQAGGYDHLMNEKGSTQPPIMHEGSECGTNERGTLAMARTGDPHSATSQFFINVVDNPFLNYGNQGHGYCAFGKVVHGMEVINRMQLIPTNTEKGHKDVPHSPVIIISAELVSHSDLDLITEGLQLERELSRVDSGKDLLRFRSGVMREVEISRGSVEIEPIEALSKGPSTELLGKSRRIAPGGLLSTEGSKTEALRFNEIGIEPIRELLEVKEELVEPGASDQAILSTPGQREELMGRAEYDETIVIAIGGTERRIRQLEAFERTAVSLSHQLGVGLSLDYGGVSPSKLGVGLSYKYTCDGNTFGDPLFTASDPIPSGVTLELASPNPFIDCSSVNKVEVYCHPVSSQEGQDILLKGYSVDLKNTAQQRATVTINIDKDGVLEVTSQGESLGEKVDIKANCMSDLD